MIDIHLNKLIEKRKYSQYIIDNMVWQDEQIQYVINIRISSISKF